jgi:hypothetical protein
MLHPVPATVHLVVVVILQIEKKKYYLNGGSLPAKTEKIARGFFSKCRVPKLLVIFTHLSLAQIPGVYPGWRSSLYLYKFV